MNTFINVVSVSGRATAANAVWKKAAYLRTVVGLSVVSLAAILWLPAASAQVKVQEQPVKSKSAFTLSTPREQAVICYDPNDALVVKKAVELFADDIEMVTGRRPEVADKAKKARSMVIVGSIENNRMIQQLAEEGRIDIVPLKGAWERYLVQTVHKPFPGVDNALVVAGSDRRGAAYGLFSISEMAGVSPWYWWADVPVQKHGALYIDAPATLSKSPSVRYRGIFLNDEDWGLKPWAAKTFEPEVGNIGPRTYGKICELLLRLKANHLAPAMHPVSTAFYKIPENKLVADTFAIVIGTSHCEPLLLNTASEWNTKTMGPWDYNKNKDKINEVLGDRVKEAAPYENVYTLALRGLHDAAMGGGDVSMKEKVKMLESALKDQRNIVAQNINKPVETIPQAFTPYKEVLEIYSNGLELPDDVTIIWPDDNYGYMKRLSSPHEQKRSGRAGVYYHLSYLGVPHSYLWFSTTAPALMYEELHKAYITTADRVWLANCGDLKGAEMQVSLFLDMAYDIDSFNADNVVTYPARWLAKMFGEQYYDEFEDVLRSHINLAFARKPEFMGWGYWNNHWGAGEKRTDTEFSFANYNEATKRLAEYKRIGDKAGRLLAAMDEEAKPAFYQLVYYPVKGAELMNRMTMNGQLYRQYVRQKRAAANPLKTNVEMLHDSLELITEGYNTLLGGKWKYMMALTQDYHGHASYYMVPLMEENYTPEGAPKLAVQAEGEDMNKGGTSFHLLPTFNAYAQKAHWVEVYNQGTGNLDWTADPSDEWIVVSKQAGKVPLQERVMVSIDWNKAPKDERISGSVTFRSGDRKEQVMVSGFNPENLPADEIKGLYIEENGYVSIPAAGFHRKFESDDIKMNILPGIGFDDDALQMGVPTAPLQQYRSANVPRVEYDFYTFNAGIYDVYTYVLPTFPLHAERDYKLPEHTNSDTKYSVRIDDGSISTPSTSAVEYSQLWYDSVLKNCRVNKSTLYVKAPGKHTLQIRCGDPGTVIQKIVIDMGGLKRSYMGPESTRYVGDAE